MLRTRTSKITATVAMAAALILTGGAANAAGTAPAPTTIAAPADASTTATGDYYYVCQYPNGSSLTLTDGTIGSCVGASYVQEYLDGRLLQTINVTGDGEVADASPECIVAVTKAGVALARGPLKAGVYLIRISIESAMGQNPCA
jgi:hypothetical protein